MQRAIREADPRGLSGIGDLFLREDLLDIMAHNPVLAPCIVQSDFMAAIQARPPPPPPQPTGLRPRAPAARAREQAIRRDPSSVGAYLRDARVQLLLQAVVMQRTPEEMRLEQQVRGEFNNLA